MTPTHAPLPHFLSRRAVLGSILVSTASLVFPQTASSTDAAESEVMPGSWRTWLLTSGDELRPAKPPPPTPDELSELIELQGQRTARMLATAAYWNDATVVMPWTDLALDLIRVHTPNPVRAARALALLHVATFDTLVATEDARVAYTRPGPDADKAIVPLRAAGPAGSSFPSQQAAVAAAASTVLAYLFPKESPETFTALADEAATSQLVAAHAYRSDVDAGQAIGHAVGERAVARGRADGSDISWDGSGRLTGPGRWQPTPPGFYQQPTEPLAGTWRPWMLASGDQYRPPAPAICCSEEYSLGSD